jgi:hypothetical protein
LWFMPMTCKVSRKPPFNFTMLELHLQILEKLISLTDNMKMSCKEVTVIFCWASWGT